MDENMLSLLYTSLVRPHLEYGNVVWGPFFKGDQKDVEKIQRRASKLIKGIKEMSYEERLRHLKLPSMQHRRRRGDMIFAYKVMTGKVGLDKDDYFINAPTSTRGHQYSVLKGKATKHCRINNFSNRVINDWNSLPSQVVSAATVDSFKRALDEHWKNGMYAMPF